MISIDAVISTDAAISSGAEATLISPAILAALLHPNWYTQTLNPNSLGFSLLGLETLAAGEARVHPFLSRDCNAPGPESLHHEPEHLKQGLTNRLGPVPGSGLFRFRA